MRVGLGLRRRLAAARELVLELGELLAHVLERAGEIRVVEADGRGAPLHLAREERRGQRLRDVVEHALAALLRRLDPLPVLPNARRRVRASTSPNTCGWRRTSFSWTRSRDLLEIPRSALLEQEREEVDLEEEVAELVEQLLVVPGERRVGDLVGLLDGVRHDRARGLLAVPRALATQPLGQLLEVDERLGEGHVVVVAVVVGP